MRWALLVSMAVAACTPSRAAEAPGGNADAATVSPPSVDASAPPPPARATPCPRTGRRPPWSHVNLSKGKRLLGAVRVGWSTARLLEHAAEPTSCSAAEWTYFIGHRDGPGATYVFTIKRGVVTRIGVSSFACKIWE